jgi:hypothetical protein
MRSVNRTGHTWRAPSGSSHSFFRKAADQGGHKDQDDHKDRPYKVSFPNVFIGLTVLAQAIHPRHRQEHQQQHPSSLNSEMVVPSEALLMNGRWRISIKDGPSSTPMSNSPSTDGYPRRVLR